MAFKMKGSPMHQGTSAHKSALKMAEKSPAKDKKEYGPYSYSHNTQKATKDHSGDPHGPAPTKQVDDKNGKKKTKVTSDDKKITATTTSTKKRLFGGKKTTTTSTSQDKEGVDYVRGDATIATTRKGGGKKKEVTIDPSGKKTVTKYDKEGNVKKTKVKKGEYRLKRGKSNKLKERAAIQKAVKIDVAAKDKAYNESKKRTMTSEIKNK